MNRLKFKALFLTLALIFIASTPICEAGSIKGGSVTVYNSGRALVTEYRSVTLPEGPASVVFKDMPETLDPTSVRASAKGMSVLDLQYSYIPITTHNLLDRFIGQELSVIMPDPTDADARILRKATLVSNAERPIFLVGGEVYVGDYEALLLPELPKDLTREPTLTLTTENKTAGKRDVRLSYLMGGLKWRADYSLTVDKAGASAALDAWATIENDSGRGFSGSEFKLVAGDVNQAGGSPRMFRAKNMAMAEMAVADAPPQPAQEQFSEYHVYSVPRPVSMTASGTKQLSLFNAPKTAVKQELASRFHTGAGQRSGEIQQNVDLTLLLENTSGNGLGQPMPAGLVRVFMPTSDGSLLLAGESRMAHLGTGGTARLALGRAFDLSVKRQQSAFKRLGKNSVEMAWRIEVRNGGSKTKQVLLNDMYSGQWEVTAANAEHTRKNAGTLEFDVKVPPSKDGNPTIINYTVRVTY